MHTARHCKVAQDNLTNAGAPHATTLQAASSEAARKQHAPVASTNTALKKQTQHGGGGAGAPHGSGSRNRLLSTNPQPRSSAMQKKA